MTDPIRIVAAGYDALASAYGDWRGRFDSDPTVGWLEAFEAFMPAGLVVDLGCAAGQPATSFMTERGRDVIGVDVSEAQLSLARDAFPGVRFVLADMAEFDLEPRSAAGVVALFSMIHVPRERLDGMLRRIRRWLIPGGAFLATFTAADNPGGTEDWLGTRMFFSGFAPHETARLLRDAGFVIVRDEVVGVKEPEGEARFHWVMAGT